MMRRLDQRLGQVSPNLGSVEAVLVSAHGKTVIAHYRNRTPSKHTNVWSVTTSVMTLLVGVAIDEGQLSLDQTLSELLPDYRSQMTPQMGSITLRHLLTMTSGIPDIGVPVFSADDTVGMILTYGTVSDPGEQFAYSRSAAHLIGAVLAEAVNRSVLDYAREKLFDPLGIDSRPAWEGWDTDSKNSGFNRPGFAWGTDRQGVHSGCCMLKLTTADMIKIGELYVNEGRWKGQRIVSAEWARESVRSQLTPGQLAAGEDSFGYGWWVGDDAYGHPWFDSGWFGHLVIGIPDLQLVIAVSSADDVSDDFQQALLPIIVEEVLKPFT